MRIAAGEAPLPGSVGDYHWSGMAGTYFWIDPAEDLIAIWLMQAPSQLDDCRALYQQPGLRRAAERAPLDDDDEHQRTA